MTTFNPTSGDLPEGWMPDSPADMPVGFQAAPVLPVREPGTALPAVPLAPFTPAAPVEPVEPVELAAVDERPAALAALVSPATLAAAVSVPVDVTASAGPVQVVDGEHIVHLVEPAPLVDPALRGRPPVAAEPTPLPAAEPNQMKGLGWVLGVSVLLVLVVVGAGFWINFSTLDSAGQDAGIAKDVSWLLAVAIDGAMGIATLVWQVLSYKHQPIKYPAFVVVFGCSVSMAAAGIHAETHHAAGMPTWGAVFISALPALMLALSVHLLTSLVSAFAPRPPKPAESAPAPKVPAPSREHDVEPVRIRRPEGRVVAYRRAAVRTVIADRGPQSKVERSGPESVRTGPEPTRTGPPPERTGEPNAKPITAPEPPARTDKPVERTGPADEPEISPELLAAARKIHAELIRKGERINRNVFLGRLRDAGVRCGSDQYSALIKVLTATNG